MYKIVIIEDDTNIAKAIKNYFSSWGYKTAVVPDFREVLSYFKNYGYF
jgi:DNA-binding response OmpR family regulator